MSTSGEPHNERMVFEVLEGIEMVPGTVHLVDSEFFVQAEKLRVECKGQQRQMWMPVLHSYLVNTG